MILARGTVVARSLEVMEEVAQSWGVMEEVVLEVFQEGAVELLTGEAQLIVEVMMVPQS